MKMVGGGMPAYTSSNGAAPPTSTASVMPFVPSHGSYQPYFPLPMAVGGPGTSSYMPQSIYIPPHARPPAFPFSQHVPHMPPIHPVKQSQATFSISVKKDISSGSSSSSCSRCSAHNRPGNQKRLSKGSSGSSDSSPSSSQYSSPPQTPSPDHTKDMQRKKKLGKFSYLGHQLDFFSNQYSVKEF